MAKVKNENFFHFSLFYVLLHCDNSMASSKTASTLMDGEGKSFVEAFYTRGERKKFEAMANLLEGFCLLFIVNFK